MFSSFRNRFGIPGVISVIALVFAMIGGAYAANDDGGKATASAKKAKKGPRGPRGPAGPAGPQGPAGPAGAKGDTGAAGANGSNGSNGADGAKGATGPTGPTGAKGATGAAGEAGEDGEDGLEGLPGATGATGPEGSPWTAGGTLPSGATLTGTWVIDGKAGGAEPEADKATKAALSFPIPLDEGLGEEDVVWVKNPSSPEAIADGCPGETQAPDADPGKLCVYPGLLFPEGLELSIGHPLNPFSPKASESGALLLDLSETVIIATGTFAVTAP